MDLLFGISLDPLAVPQRHALYDSDEEQEGEEAGKQGELSSVFSVRGDSTRPLEGKKLAVAVGSTASVFLRSFLRLREETVLSVHAEGDRVSEGRFFPSAGGSQAVSRLIPVEGGGQWVACVHETVLRVELCNLWAEKVRRECWLSVQLASLHICVCLVYSFFFLIFPPPPSPLPPPPSPSSSCLNKVGQLRLCCFSAVHLTSSSVPCPVKKTTPTS